MDEHDLVQVIAELIWTRGFPEFDQAVTIGEDRVEVVSEHGDAFRISVERVGAGV